MRTNVIFRHPAEFVPVSMDDGMRSRHPTMIDDGSL
jgi:hypothetical protein